MAALLVACGSTRQANSITPGVVEDLCEKL
jgi:hypothetical protein